MYVTSVDFFQWKNRTVVSGEKKKQHRRIKQVNYSRCIVAPLFGWRLWFTVVILTGSASPRLSFPFRGVLGLYLYVQYQEEQLVICIYIWLTQPRCHFWSYMWPAPFIVHSLPLLSSQIRPIDFFLAFCNDAIIFPSFCILCMHTLPMIFLSFFPCSNTRLFLSRGNNERGCATPRTFTMSVVTTCDLLCDFEHTGGDIGFLWENLLHKKKPIFSTNRVATIQPHRCPLQEVKRFIAHFTLHIFFVYLGEDNPIPTIRIKLLFLKKLVPLPVLKRGMNGVLWFEP